MGFLDHSDPCDLFAGFDAGLPGAYRNFNAAEQVACAKESVSNLNHDDILSVTTICDKSAPKIGRKAGQRQG